MNLLRLIPVCALCLLCAAEVPAQVGGGMGGGMGGGRGSRGSEERPRQAEAPPDPANPEQIAYRLGLLEDDLQLQPAQLGPWQVFAARVRSLAGDAARDRARGRSVSAVTPGDGLRHLRRAMDIAQNHLTALEDVEAAARALCKTLDSRQLALVDARMGGIVDPQGDGGAKPMDGARRADAPGGGR